MGDSTLSGVEAVEIASELPGVSAWVSPITITPLGLGFSVYAKTDVRGVRYHVSAVTELAGETVWIGGSNSADAKFSMTQLWWKVEPDQVQWPLTIRIYEADGHDPADRRHIETLTAARQL
ncbi:MULTISPECIES: hypothetical protein [Gordonia]|uniref:hypothetical protein n=1 Tax=Gordonia TaxID=2053 RepID=UPI000A57FBDE|nr:MULTISPECIES: hypothetical protein [Gordonia]